jgi:hypothetical protein
MLDDRFGSKGDILALFEHVRFAPDSDGGDQRNYGDSARRFERQDRHFGSACPGQRLRAARVWLHWPGCAGVRHGGSAGCGGGSFSG